jgi:hypothetical protein
MEILILLIMLLVVFNSIILIMGMGVVTKNQGFILEKIEELKRNQNKDE